MKKENCLVIVVDLMWNIPDKSIDLIFADLPFGTTLPMGSTNPIK